MQDLLDKDLHNEHYLIMTANLALSPFVLYQGTLLKESPLKRRSMWRMCAESWMIPSRDLKQCPELRKVFPPCVFVSMPGNRCLSAKPKVHREPVSHKVWKNRKNMVSVPAL